MANPKFFFDDIIGATLTADYTNVNYPLSNLQDGQYISQWRSGSTVTDQTLTVEFDAARAVDTVIVSGHNFNSVLADLVYVEFWTGAVWQIWSSASVYTSTVLSFSGTLVSKAKWRLRWTRNAELSEDPRVGVLYIGKKFQTTYPCNRKPKYGNTFDTHFGQSVSGVRYASQEYSIRRLWSLNFPLIPTADYTEFARMYSLVRGRLHPLFFAYTDGIWRFVRLQNDENLFDKEIGQYDDTSEIELIEGFAGYGIQSLPSDEGNLGVGVSLVYKKKVLIVGTKASPELFTTNSGKLALDERGLSFPSYSTVPMIETRAYQERKVFLVPDPSLAGSNVQFYLALDDVGSASDGTFDGPCYADIYFIVYT